MNKDKWIIIAVFSLIIGIALGLGLLHGNDGNGEKTTRPVEAPATRPVIVGEFRGMSLQMNNPNPNHNYSKYVTEIAKTGANTLCLSLAGYQENCSSTSIFIDSRKVPGDNRVKALIDHAHKLKLRVVLMPIVLLENPREGKWRGNIGPKNWDPWWDRYTQFILHYARLAERTKTEVFIVGSELISTERYEKRWRKVIAAVRKEYGGLLSYSSNWDHYEVVKFWDALDMVGMTVYYDLTDGKKPTLPRLMKSWKPIRQKILNWQAKIKRPILFTEVGWPNQVTCAQFPWDYYRAENQPDPQAQKNCFEAFFRTWANEKVVAGYLIWEWRNTDTMKLGPKDTSYVPIGKPCMKVISKYYRAPGPYGHGPWARTKPAGAARHGP